MSQATSLKMLSLMEKSIKIMGSRLSALGLNRGREGHATCALRGEHDFNGRLSTQLCLVGLAGLFQ